jgi:hypothetical protein
MTQANDGAAHAAAYQAVVKGLLDPAHLDAAKNNPVVKPIFDKLTDDDVQTLSNIATAQQTQQGTVCNPTPQN